MAGEGAGLAQNSGTKWADREKSPTLVALIRESALSKHIAWDEKPGEEPRVRDVASIKVIHEARNLFHALAVEHLELLSDGPYDSGNVERTRGRLLEALEQHGIHRDETAVASFEDKARALLQAQYPKRIAGD